MVITMQDYDEIRRRYLAGESQRHIAKTMGISRNTVKKYCEGNAVPWERKTPERQSTILTDDIVQFIQNCLDDDESEGLKKTATYGKTYLRPSRRRNEFHRWRVYSSCQGSGIKVQNAESIHTFSVRTGGGHAG